MAKIRVDPPVLQQCSRDIINIQNRLNEIGGNVSRAVNNISSNLYEGQLRRSTQRFGPDARNRASRLSGQVGAVSSSLRRKADAFQAAEMAGVAGFKRTSKSLAALMDSSRLGEFLERLAVLRVYQIEQYLKLGRLLFLDDYLPQSNNLFLMPDRVGQFWSGSTFSGIELGWLSTRNLLLGLKFFEKLEKSGDIATFGLIAFSMKSGTTYSNQVRFYGSEFIKKWGYGFDKVKTTHISANKFITKQITSTNTIKGSAGAVTLALLAAQWVQDYYTYKDKGTEYLGAAFSVDAGISALTVGATMKGMLAGAAIGSAFGPVGTVIGGLAGGIAASWAVDYALNTPISTLLPQIGETTGRAIGSNIVPIFGGIYGEKVGQQAGTLLTHKLFGSEPSEITLKEIAVEQLADGINNSAEWINYVSNTEPAGKSQNWFYENVTSKLDNVLIPE